MNTKKKNNANTIDTELKRYAHRMLKRLGPDDKIDLRKERYPLARRLLAVFVFETYQSEPEKFHREGKFMQVLMLTTATAVAKLCEPKPETVVKLHEPAKITGNQQG